MEELWNILNSNVILGLLFLFVILPLYIERGWFGKLLGKNGNGKEKEIESLRLQISTLQDNHIHGIEEKLDKFIEKMIEHNIKVMAILEDIKNNLNER